MNDLAKRIEAAMGYPPVIDCYHCAHLGCDPENPNDDKEVVNPACDTCGTAFNNWHPDADLVGELLNLIPANEEEA